MDNGERGLRYFYLISIIKRFIGVEDVLVVNNNVVVVFFVFSIMVKGGEVIVFCGELVEVGGLFRILSIMVFSGVELVEVGLINKIYLKDYKEVIIEDINVLMKVYISNYRIMGFIESVFIEELVNLGKKYKLFVIEDLGSGVFIDLLKYGLFYELIVLDFIW